MALGKVDLTQVVFPVPLGPKRKKLLFLGGFSNLEYIIPFYIYFWSCQVLFVLSDNIVLKKFNFFLKLL